jgi:hypothetical protein
MIGLAPGTRFRIVISPEVLRCSCHFQCFFFNSKLNLKLLKVNFLENNFSESRQAQKAIDKPSPMGLGTLRSNGGVVQNGRFARVT